MYETFHDCSCYSRSNQIKIAELWSALQSSYSGIRQKCDFLLNAFSASTNWFWWFETLWEKGLNCLLFPEWNRVGIFLWQWRKKLLLTRLGDFGVGGRGSGKNHFSARGFSGLARLASFYLCHVYRFFRCSSCLRHGKHGNDSSFGDADPGIPGYKH